MAASPAHVSNRPSIGVLCVIRTIQHFNGCDGPFATDQLFQRSGDELLEIALSVRAAHGDRRFERELDQVLAAEMQQAS